MQTVDINIEDLKKQNDKILKKLNEVYPELKLTANAKRERIKFFDHFFSKYINIIEIKEDIKYILTHKNKEELLTKEEIDEVETIEAFFESDFYAELTRKSTRFFMHREFVLIPIIIGNLNTIKYKLKE